VAQMLIASALYALHLPFNQRVLFDMPAPTVTLYTLIAMSAVVVPTFLFSGSIQTPQAGALVDGFTAGIERYGAPVAALTLVTFFSRLTLFLGVKHLGGMQTAILGLGELLITLLFSRLLLGESFSMWQWVGAALLTISLGLVALD